MEPQKVEFGKKIIFTPIEKNIPVVREMVFQNPEAEAIDFVIDDSSIAADRVFAILPLKGRVEGG